MSNNLTIISELDRLLIWLANNENRQKPHTFNRIYRNFKDNYPSDTLVKDIAFVVNSALNKMMKDELVEEVNKTFIDDDTLAATKDTGYQITLAGLLFLEQGGYQGQLKRLNASVDRQAMEDLRNDNEYHRNIYQFWIAVSIGVSTGIAAIYYIFALFDYYKQHSLNFQYAAYFLSGFVLGLLPLLIKGIIKKIANKKQLPS